MIARLFPLAVAFGLVALAPAALAQGAGTSTPVALSWDFSCDSHANGHHVMFQRVATYSCVNDDVSLVPGSPILWQADKSVTVPHAIRMDGASSGSFVLELQLRQSNGLMAELVVVDASGSVVKTCASREVPDALLSPIGPMTNVQPVRDVTVRVVNVPFGTPGTCVLEPGESLGVRLTATGGNALVGIGPLEHPLTGRQNGTALHYRGTTPYPTPEIPSVVLTTAGLAVVAMAMIVRRRS